AHGAAPAARRLPAGAFNGFNGANRSAPRLRLSGRANGNGWLVGGSAGGARSSARAGSRTTAVREPRLKLGRGGSPGGSALGAPVRGAALGAAFSSGGQPKVRFGTRRGEGVLGGSLAGSSPFSSSPFGGSPFGGSGRGGPRPGKWLTGPGAGGALTGNSRQTGNSPLARSRFGRSRVGRSLLGGSVFSRSPSSALSVPARRPAVVAAPRFSVRSRNAQHGPLGRYRRQGMKGAFGRQGRLRLYGQRQPRRYGRQGRHSRLGRLAAALRTPALARPARTSAPRGSAFRTSAPAARGARRRALGRSPGKGWLRRRSPRPALSRGAVGGKTPRLRMSRRNGANRRRRRAGYR
ncbi:MAG: hypothetical protein JO132_04745, partial [Streptosporangiaceae bacterium]|nr:hypothetical protein [Streptosporangiaceae bacterium]